MRQPGGFGDFRVGVVVASAHLGHRLQHGHALQHGGHFFQRRGGAQAVQAQRFGGFHHRAPVATRQRINQPEHITAVHAAQHGAHAGLVNAARAESNRLIGQRERIAHRATRGTREQAQRLRLGGHVFNAQHTNQMFQNGFRCHRSQVELQAARQHGGRDFLRVGRGEHEFEVFRRLFQRLEHGVERRVRQHVNFVNHEDFKAPDDRLVNRLLQ